MRAQVELERDRELEQKRAREKARDEAAADRRFGHGKGVVGGRGRSGRTGERQGEWGVRDAFYFWSNLMPRDRPRALGIWLHWSINTRAYDSILDEY